ncbi:MAG: hypothetical protein VX947_01670, partial [Chloroflexota bacterium]|nr:hypothetical protein [Chloroflexota bacterium]
HPFNEVDPTNSPVQIQDVHPSTLPPPDYSYLREKAWGGIILNRRYGCGSTASVAHYYSAVYT